jgi:tRNA-Thr(GGU) m(6)t(6)A37 methyltransferase TsaA
MAEGARVIFKPIGIVRTGASDDEIRSGRGDHESTVEIFPEFEDALDGIDGFSHIFVLSYLNKLRPEQIGPLKVKPRRFLREGLKLEELPLVGVFSLDSPTRPNQIGLSLVKLARRDGRKLVVLGLDLFDGTPVLDIKTYKQAYRIDQYEIAKWYQELAERAERPI